MPYQTFLDSLSVPRAGVYRRVFRTASIEETSGAVLWGQSMGMALQALTHTFEVALRNRIHTSLSVQATEASGNPLASCAWYDPTDNFITLTGETASKVGKILNQENGLPRVPAPSPDRVIARLPFGTWPNVLDSQMPTPTVETRTFQDVFPNHPRGKKHWKYNNNRKQAVGVVKDVRDWRNRIAHCRPVWSEGWFRSSPTQHWGEVLARLKSRRAEVIEVLEWICPHTAQVYRQGFAGRWFDELATESTLWAHLSTPLVAGISPTYAAVDVQALQAFKARR